MRLSPECELELQALPRLKITDLRVATVVKPGPSPCPIIRIDTNQGVYGLGEVRDGASATYALFLKSRIVGENPLQLDRIFRKIKQFGGPARQAGGVCAIEMASGTLPAKSTTRPSMPWWAVASFATRFAFMLTQRNPMTPRFTPSG